MSSVIRVAVENIAPLWSQVEPLVIDGMRDVPTHTAEDVRLLLISHRCHLWIQWDEHRVEAIVITEFAVYPRGIWLRMWIIAARRDAKIDDDLFFNALEEWRLANGCRGYEGCGRHGWLRRLKMVKMEGLVVRVTYE